MSKLTQPIISALIAVAITITCVPPVAAQTSAASSCTSGGILFGFFNGVLNTESQAKDSLLAFEKKYGSTSPQGDPIRYEVFYNQTEGFSDFVEVFEQRLNEHGAELAGRFELFFSALNGGGSWWSTITSAVPALGGVLDGFLQWINAIIPRALTQNLGSPSLASMQSEHRTRLDNGHIEGRKMLLVAHSQGNLFLNSILEYASTRIPSTAVKAVNGIVASGPLSRPQPFPSETLGRAWGMLCFISPPIDQRSGQSA